MRSTNRPLALILAGAVVALFIAMLVFFLGGKKGAGDPVDSKRSTSASTREGHAWDSGSEESRDASKTRPEETRTPDFSSPSTKRAFAIHDEAREFLKNAELKRAEVFLQDEDKDGNSTSAMILKRPDADELSRIFEEYLGSLSGQDREFVEKTGLSATLRNELEDFFDYEKQYRYVTFRLPGDGSIRLPSVMVLESDRYYDKQLAAEGKLDIPFKELNLREWADLKIGDSKLERYGKLFSMKEGE